MKKVSFISIMLLGIALFSACTKTQTGCIPQPTPCPEGPKAVGMAVIPQGEQVGNYVFDVTIYYTNPGDNNSGGLKFYIGAQEYAAQTSLQHADSTSLGAASFTIALLVDTFTIKTVGYNTPQRCDCDSTISNLHYEPLATSQLYTSPRTRQFFHLF